MLEERNLMNGVSYSTQEQDTGLTWIDGKKIYQKTVNMGRIAGVERIRIPHGINNLERIIKHEGFTQKFIPLQGSSAGAPIPYPGNEVSEKNDPIAFFVKPTTIDIMLLPTSGEFNECYVTLFYTCTNR